MLPILSYVQHYKKYHAARFEAASVQYGLNQLEIDILLFLHNNPDCRTASDICRYRGLAKSNVSAAVERLRARGVLTVSPAPDALPMVAVLADIQRRSLEPLFAGFTAQEQQTLQDYLRRMDANLLRELNKE
ncbi:MarR family winged helix-turn-helix transcriptional regulator [Gemmiger formicilis]